MRVPLALLPLVLLLAPSTAGAVDDHAAAPAGSEPVRFVREWGRQGSAPGEFDFPIGVAVGPSGSIYVTDHYNARVQKFDADGKLLSHFPTLPNPGGVAVNAEGRVYVSHFQAGRAEEGEPPPHCVAVYGPAGERLRQWGQKGAGDGEFDCPGGIAIGRGGRIYVADQTNRRVQAFDAEGRFLLKWGSYGSGPGEFGGGYPTTSRVGGPQFLVAGRDGSVYTTEASPARVQKFDADGKFLAAWGSGEDRPGGFGGRSEAGLTLEGPIGVCLDGDRNLWVTAVSGRVQRFRPDGAFLCAAGAGQGDGAGEFMVPHGVAWGDGRLYVVDSFNHRVQAFATGE